MKSSADILDINAFNGKDLSAYNYVFKFYYPALCNFASRMVTGSDAQDIVEDLFVKIWAGHYNFRDTEHLKAFLFHSIKNASLDVIKKNKRAGDRNMFYTESQSGQESDYLANIIRAEVMMELHQAIAELPAEKGKIIRMTYLEGKSNQETADALNISIQTVKNQKLRGLAILRSKLPDGIYSLLFLYPFLK